MIGVAALPAEDAPSIVWVWSSDQLALPLAAGRRLTFGRGQGVDLFVPGGLDLSRRAGEIVALGVGAWIANISRTHSLYVEGRDYHVRLPPSGNDGPLGGWLVARGTAVVGSRVMMRQGAALRLDVAAIPGDLPAAPRADGCPGGAESGGTGTGLAEHGDADEITVRPLRLRPDTKLFLVALLLCRPWLVDSSHATAIPTAPQILRAALQLTDARHQLGLLDRDPVFRDRLVEQVNDHLKYLRERVLACGLAPVATRLTPTVMAEVLLANDVLTRADLAMFEEPGWRSRQEDLWWRTVRDAK
ncbi:MAG TPA: hypothetical protein VII22_02735 [Streptosporangiaceae bacterium]